MRLTVRDTSKAPLLANAQSENCLKQTNRRSRRSRITSPSRITVTTLASNVTFYTWYTRSTRSTSYPRLAIRTFTTTLSHYTITTQKHSYGNDNVFWLLFVFWN